MWVNFISVSYQFDSHGSIVLITKATSLGSGEPTRAHSLARAFVARSVDEGSNQKDLRQS